MGTEAKSEEMKEEKEVASDKKESEDNEVKPTEPETEAVAVSTDSKDEPEGEVEAEPEVKKEGEESKDEIKESSTEGSEKEYPGGPILLEGELLKQGFRGIKSWKKRRFILQSQKIRYFDRSKETGIIDISSVTSVNEKKRDRTFEFEIVTPQRTYHLRAQTEELRRYWIDTS